MKCQEIEALICDYIDGTLPREQRTAVAAHLEICAACAEMARDSAAVIQFMSSVEAVEPPPELLTKLVFHAPSSQKPAADAVEKPGWWQRFVGPVLQPRFAMGMAMTILSFSMTGKILGWQPRQLTAADLNPSRVWMSLEDQLHRGYDRALKYYENLRLVYEIQTRLNEWSAEEEAERKQSARDSGSRKQ
jgi:anti-sigma factor RsiW